MRMMFSVLAFVFLLTDLLIAQPIGLNTVGNPIGITAWGAMSWQLHTSDTQLASEGGASPTMRFGINLKYGSWGLFSKEKKTVSYSDTNMVEYTKNPEGIQGRYIITQKERSRHWARVSYGIGYQSIVGLKSPNNNLLMNFNLSGPYSGFYFSIPLFEKIDNATSKDSVDNHCDVLSIVIAYNATLLSADGLNSSFTANNPSGVASKYALSTKLSTTVMHDLDIGIGLQVSKHSWFFIEAGYSYLKFTNVLHSPANDAVKISEIYDTTPKQLDFSSWVVKAGFSGNF
jgi:hypothetical protein